MADWLVLFVLFGTLFTVSDHLFLNGAILIGAYVCMRYLKKGKPAYYALHLGKFLISTDQAHVLTDDRQIRNLYERDAA